jgi:hypothetical protein
MNEAYIGGSNKEYSSQGHKGYQGLSESGDSHSLTIEGLLLGHKLRLLLDVLGHLTPHGIVAYVDPLGHAPLDALDDWTSGVE